MINYQINAYKVIFDTATGEKIFYNLRLLDEKGLAAELGLFHEIKSENIEGLLRLAGMKMKPKLEVLPTVPKECKGIKRTKRIEGIRYEPLNEDELKKVTSLARYLKMEKS